MKKSVLAILVLAVSIVSLLTGCVERRVYVPVATAPPPQQVVVSQPPPAPPSEVVVAAPGPDYVWVPGHWDWQGRWVWVSGGWMVRPRPHAAWVPGHWVHHRHGGYIWIGGYWR